MFGRFLRAKPEPVETTEQTSRLFEAKKRALEERQVPRKIESAPTEKPTPPNKPSNEAVIQSKPSTPKRENKPPSDSSGLASQLLKKKRDREN